jgi:hypothetical protein
MPWGEWKFETWPKRIQSKFLLFTHYSFHSIHQIKHLPKKEVKYVLFTQHIYHIFSHNNQGLFGCEPHVVTAH